MRFKFVKGWLELEFDILAIENHPAWVEQSLATLALTVSCLPLPVREILGVRLSFANHCVSFECVFTLPRVGQVSIHRNHADPA